MIKLHTRHAPPYKDVLGRFRTRSLFLELCGSNRANKEDYFPIWTLRDTDYEIKNPANWYYTAYEDHIYPSLKKLYLTFADPTEYAFAVEHLGSWEHWKTLSECSWFKSILATWRADLETKLKAEAIRTVREAAINGDVQAAKWLHQVLTPKELGPGRGRPSKIEVAGEIKRQASEEKELMDDLARIHPPTVQ